MKRTAFLLPLLCLPALFFSSCRSGQGDASEDFASAELLAPDSIAIGQILQPMAWKISEDKAVLLSQKTDSAFFVYRLPAFEYLYSFGAKGEGPDDFSYPFLRTESADEQEFSALDLMKNIRHFYTLGDTAACKTGSDTFGERLYNVLFPVNDSVFLQQNSDISGDYLLSYYCTVTPEGETIDSIIPLSHTKSFRIARSKETIGIHGTIYNSPRLAYRNGRLAIFYSDLRRTDLFDITPQGRFVLCSSTGDASTREQINAMDLENLEKGYTVCAIQGTPDHIYLLCADFRKDPELGRKILHSYVEVYDWEGRPVKKFDLGRPFDRFLVVPRYGKIFCYLSDEDFKQVFSYDYHL